MRLTVITACTRLENLPLLLKSFGDRILRWIIVVDTPCDLIDIKLSGDNQEIIVLKYEGSPACRDGGQHAKNFGLDFALKRGGAGRYIYFLDDDNVMHPDFFDSLEQFIGEGRKNPDLFVFEQALDDEGWNRPVSISIGKIDQAQYAVKASSIGTARIPEMYSGDGAFIIGLNDGIRSIEIIHKPLCYYNRLGWE